MLPTPVHVSTAYATMITRMLIKRTSLQRDTPVIVMRNTLGLTANVNDLSLVLTGALPICTVKNNM